MALNTLRNRDDWLKAELGPHLHYTLDGALELTPANLCNNQYLSEVDELGDPLGYPFVHVPRADGYLIGVSKLGKGDGSITFQNLEPLLASRPGYLQAQPIIEGRKPIRNPAHAADLVRPTTPPRVTYEDTARAGLKGGTRWWRYTFVTPDGLETMASPAAQFTNANGQSVRFPMPSEVPAGLRVGIYCSPEGKGQEECRRQRVWDPRRGDYTLGTFRWGRRLPTRNETYLGTSTPVRFKRDIRRDRYAVGDLKAAEWRFAATQVSDYGEGLPSAVRDSRIVQEETPGSGIREKEAWWVKAPWRKRGAVGWRIYCQIDGVWYVGVYASRTRDLTSYFSYSRSPNKPRPFTGEGTAGEGGEAQLIRGREFVLVQQDPPTEDASGIEAPTAEPEPAVGVGVSYPAAGRYRVLYAPTANGEIGLPSPVAIADVATGKVMRITPPMSVNLIPNAEGVEQDPNGTPFDITVVRTNGTYSCDAGVHKITTNGAVAATSGTPVVTFSRVEVTQNKPHSVAGKIKVTAVSGNGRLVLRQIKADNSVVSTVLASLTDTDYREISQAAPLEPDTVAYEIRVDMTGTTRNMTVEVWDLILVDLPYVPRKFAKGAAGEPADFSPPADTPYPNETVHAVGPAPGPVAVEPEPPLSTVDFEDNPALANGSVYQGWTVTTNQTFEVRPESAIDGSYGLHVRDLTATSSGATARMHQVFSVPGDSLALRFKVRCLQRPSWTDSYAVLGEIRGAGGELMGLVRHYRNGDLTLVSVSRAGKAVETRILILNVGDTADIEIIATNAGTASGVLDALVGKNGEKRVVRGSISPIDWRNLSAVRLEVAFLRESDARAQSEYDFDSFAATLRGDAIEDSRPPSTQTFVPDVPTDASGNPILFGEDEGGNPIRINQIALFVHPNQPEVPLGLQDVPVCAVKPGMNYAAAVWGRHVMGDEPWHPWTLYLYAADGETHEIGSLYGDGGCFGESPWTDLTRTFTVPERADGPSFTELRVTFRGFPVGGGYFLWQGPIRVSEGAVPKEGYGRQVGGGADGRFAVTLLGRTPDLAGVEPVGSLETGWRYFGLKPEEVPEGTTLGATFYSSETDLSWGAAYTDPALVPRNDLARVEGVLTGDGVRAPRVPLDGPAVDIAHALPVLLLPGREPLPSGSIVSGLELPPDRPFEDIKQVGGDVRSTPTTGRKRYLPPFTVGVFTEAAANLLEETRPEGELQIEAPLMGADRNGRGRILTIRPNQVIDVETVHEGFVMEGHYRVWGTVTIENAQVIEMGPL